MIMQLWKQPIKALSLCSMSTSSTPSGTREERGSAAFPKRVRSEIASRLRRYETWQKGCGKKDMCWMWGRSWAPSNALRSSVRTVVLSIFEDGSLSAKNTTVGCFFRCRVTLIGIRMDKVSTKQYFIEGRTGYFSRLKAGHFGQSNLPGWNSPFSGRREVRERSKYTYMTRSMWYSIHAWQLQLHSYNHWTRILGVFLR